MRTQYKTTLFLAVGALCMSIVAPLRATIIFNNSAHDQLTRFDPSTSEVGNEIILAGTARYLTNFSFEYWGTNSTGSSSFAGTNVQARVRFYQNNGPPFNGYPSPGTNFYDSSWFDIAAPTPRSTENFFVGSDFPWTGLFLPVSDMTWSVQFRGMGATDTVGVDLYSPPVVGQAYPDYWLNIGDSWELRTNNNPLVHMDFGAVMQARALGQPYLTNSIFKFFGVFEDLELSWDSAFLGWELQGQTNAFGVGITTNWHTVPGSSVVTHELIAFDKANGSVFFRLISP